MSFHVMSSSSAGGPSHVCWDVDGCEINIILFYHFIIIQ